MRVESISEQLLFATIPIYTTSANGDQGSGTGFVFSFFKDENEYLFLVTNKHVVAGAKSGRMIFTKSQDGKPKVGENYTIDFADFESMWFGHPNPEIDITVTPFMPIIELANNVSNANIFYRTISNKNIPSSEEIEDLDAIEAVTFIGYPNGIWDKVNLLPVSRRGHSATPINVDFEGTKTFLIDASVFGGSSGSPVFILNQGSFSHRGGITVGTRFYFIGVIAAVYFRNSVGEVRSVPIPSSNKIIVESREMIDLGIVFKASTVIETISALLEQQRQR